MRKIYLLAIMLCLLSCKKYIANEDYNSTGFTFSLQDTTGVLATGKTNIKLVVKKSLTTNKDLKVVFSTNKGTLQYTESYFNGDDAVSYLLLDNGGADYYLKAKIMDGTTILTEKTIGYTSKSVKGDTYTVELLDTAGIRADGTSMIKLQVNRTTAADKKIKVVFSSTKGTIKIPEAYFSGAQSASYLQLDREPGTYFISAIVKDGDVILDTKQFTYKSTTAFPASILFGIDKKYYNISDPITLKVLLLDKTGTNEISSGLKVNYAAYQLSSNGTKTPVGRFVDALNVRTDADGKLPSVVFQPDNQIDISKKIYLEVSSKSATGADITHVIELDYK